MATGEVKIPEDGPPTSEPPSAECGVRVLKRRLLMLATFSVSSMLNALIVPLYVCMSDVSGCYYGISQDSVSWTVTTVLLVYLLLMLPATKLFSVVGLKGSVLLGSISNTVACALLFLAAKADGFAYVMVSVVFAAITNVLILGIPPFLAATWFPSDEVSRACAVGVFGNQLGLGIGYVLPPLLIPSDCSHKDSIEEGKWNLASIYTGVNALIVLLIAFTFEGAPPSFPSQVEMDKKLETETPSNKSVVIRMMKNKHFLIILCVYGLSVGHFFAIGVILNNLVSKYLEDATSVEKGWMGFSFIACGVVGAVVAGFVLDATKRYKQTSLAILGLSLIAQIVFSGLLFLRITWVAFITISLYGFFLTSFLPVGYEYGVELTYPDSEYVCASLMNTSSNIFGIIITEAASTLLENVGPVATNATLAVSLVLCCFALSFVTTDYKRSKQILDGAS